MYIAIWLVHSTRQMLKAWRGKSRKYFIRHYMCPKCGTKMKMSRCAKGSIACVIIEDVEKEEHRVTVFSDILSKIL